MADGDKATLDAHCTNEKLQNAGEMNERIIENDPLKNSFFLSLFID